MSDNDNYEINLEHGRGLISTEQTLGRDYYKALLALSGGALGFSVTLVSGVFGPVLLKLNLQYLYYSWLLFVLSIVCILISIKASHISFQIEIEDLYSDLNSDSPERYQGKWVTVSTYLDWFSFFMFLVGLLLLLLFIFNNIAIQGQNL